MLCDRRQDRIPLLPVCSRDFEEIDCTHAGILQKYTRFTRYFWVNTNSSAVSVSNIKKRNRKNIVSLFGENRLPYQNIDEKKYCEKIPFYVLSNRLHWYESSRARLQRRVLSLCF